MEAATTEQKTSEEQQVSSFAKSLFLGEIHEELVFPYPMPSDEEQEKVRGLIRSLREYTDEAYDAKRFEEETWIPDEVARASASAA